LQNTPTYVMVGEFIHRMPTRTQILSPLLTNFLDKKAQKRVQHFVK